MVSKPARPQIPFEGDEVDDLTIEYPSSDGERMAESEWQYTPMIETASTLRVRYHERRGNPARPQRRTTAGNLRIAGAGTAALRPGSRRMAAHPSRD